MRLKLGAICLLALCPFTLRAQGNEDLWSRIETAFKELEPAWKTERTYPSRTADPFTQNIVFRRGKSQALIAVESWKNETDAKDTFAGVSLGFDNMVGRRMVKSSLPKLGDENHIWTHRGSTAWPTIKFRKGNIIVTVFAPSVVIAKRFAQHILDQIEAR